MQEDGQLLLRYQRQGDVDSLSALVARNARWLLAYLRGVVASDSDAEDAFQEVWVRVIRSGSYRGGSLRAYLARIARSVAVDRFRRDGRPMASLDSDGADGLEALPDASPTPDAVVELRANAEDVRAAIRSLPVGQREVLVMRVEGELSFREIADLMGIPLGTALTWMHAATVRLRKMLGDENE